MCGIVGLMTLSVNVDLRRLETARDVLAHRGPDGVGLWSDSPLGSAHIALGHRRLSVLDLTTRASQPLLLDSCGKVRPATLAQTGDAELALVFNGEIYNYIELRSDLQRTGATFVSSGDTEVLLRAYEHWGESCVERFNGMFAFALWDRKRKVLFCARDRFGEKPFHYVLDENAGVFAFASEVKALVAMGIVRPVLEQKATFRYFKFGELAGTDQTIWQGVRRLLPGHAMSVRLEGARITRTDHRYWDVDQDRTYECNDDDAHEQFAGAFRESVRMRLRSDVPVGTSLSGGLDSSSVLCQVHALGAAAGQMAFTARMTDPRLDEGPYVDAVLTATGIPGVSILPTPQLLISELDTLCYHQEEPFPTTSIFASYLVQGLAKQYGVTVLLDGQGADEFLAGYTHYPAVLLSDFARKGQFGSWRRERHAVRQRLGADPVPPRVALRLFLGALRGSVDTLTVAPPLKDDVLNVDFKEAHSDERPRCVAVRRDALGTRMYADLTLGHLQELLRYADRNSMAHSREVRLPFLDHRLVELTLSLSRRQVFSAGESKRVLRHAMKSLVPQTVLQRRDKIGFVTPWAEWWSGACGDVLAARLKDAEMSLRDVVRPGAARAGSRDALSIISLAACKAQLESRATS